MNEYSSVGKSVVIIGWTGRKGALRMVVISDWRL
jgi:hypothetical protein